MNLKNNVLELIGNTPLVKLNNISSNTSNPIIVKLESFNPGASIKDRIALNMIEKAEETGTLTKNSVIIEATSGNTGIGLALVCAVKKYKTILIMPEHMSIERRKVMQALGAEIILTPKEKGMLGALEKAQQLLNENSNYFMLRQFENPANPEIHIKTTAKEIWEDTEGKVDIIVCGIGTGGTATGIAKALKVKKKNIEIIAVEPKESAVLSGEKAGSHKIQGIGAGFIPEILDLTLIDRIIKIKSDEAFQTSKALMSKEGILAGISSGAIAAAAIKVHKEEKNAKKMILAILPDSAERYLSTELFKV